MKIVRTKVKTTQNSKKKHENKIEIKLCYDKGSSVPTGINIHKNCTTLDMIVAITRLVEVVCEDAKAEDKSVTAFIVNCAKAYADQCDD